MAGKVGGKRPGAGRPKGSPNKAKVRESQAFTAALATAVTGIPRNGVILPSKAPTVAPPGISPLDLLLATMRNAWEAAHTKALEAEEIEAKIKDCADSDIAEGFRKAANACRLDAGRQVTLAQAAANQAAPYLHAKLQTVDQNIAGNITVEIRQF